MKILSYIGLILLMLTNSAYAEDSNKYIEAAKKMYDDAEHYVLSNPDVPLGELRIGIKEVKPFAYKTNGRWTGISVDLIESLSKEFNFNYKFIPFKNTTELINAAQANKVDMSIAAISITHDREEKIDFTHKYYTTKLGILSKDSGDWVDTAIWIIKRIAYVLLFFITALYIVGYLISRIEGDKNIVGAHSGAWWALVTFSTTGYGDEVPKTNAGKIVASIWIVSSLFLISIFTGYISSTLTVKNLTESPTTLAALDNANVYVVRGSPAQGRLILLGMGYITVNHISEALTAFETDKKAVVVHDAALLKFYSNSMKKVTVWDIENSETDYAIVLPPRSVLTERINLGILSIIASPEWKVIQQHYNIL